MRLVFLLLVTSTLTFAQAIRLGQFDEIKVFDLLNKNDSIL